MHVAAAREREESESAGEMKQGSCEGEGAPQRRESCASQYHGGRKNEKVFLKLNFFPKVIHRLGGKRDDIWAKCLDCIPTRTKSDIYWSFLDFCLDFPTSQDSDGKMWGIGSGMKKKQESGDETSY